MKNIRWSDLKRWQKAVLIEIGLTEVGLFAAAWVDLNHRLAENVNGNKKAWRAALFTGGIGSLAYLIKGRRRSNWTERDMPNLHGKVAIVTGANSGIGYETARALSQHGATVIMACRNMDKANRARDQICALNLKPTGELLVMPLDLADLDSVRHFADKFKAQYNQLDLLINNAGLMVQPFHTTKQGFESQFGVNHLGHFALTAQLIDLLNSTPSARIVTVSSIAHRFGEIDFDDLNWQHKPYDAMPAYGQSKLANLLFTYELQRKLSQAGHNTIAVAVHPGYTATKLQSDITFTKLMNRLLAQPQPMGALPTLYAATARDVQGGQYFGPSGLAELGGHPFRVESNAQSHDLATAKRLWAVSEAVTETTFWNENRSA